MFILNEDEETLVNVDNVAKFYVESNFVKAKLINGETILLLKCDNRANAKQELNTLANRLKYNPNEQDTIRMNNE